MSYTVMLWCRCRVYISCNPTTGLAHSRIVEARGNNCPVKRHEPGARLWLWELLPHPRAAEGVSAETLARQYGEPERPTEQATSISSAWSSALIERGWIEGESHVTLRPKADRRSH